ncbi:MAG TPA: hypothetical protein G4O20_07460 [Dehalococcoidia bacterium]|nr:hypothetical protein [Dehalococcoidia bacterium]
MDKDTWQWTIYLIAPVLLIDGIVFTLQDGGWWIIGGIANIALFVSLLIHLLGFGRKPKGYA